MSSWGCCPHCNGVAIIDAQVSLQSRQLCHHCNIVVALVAMALLPSSSWCHCPHHDGIIAIVDMQASLPLSQWRHCPCCAGAIANIAQVLLPLLCRRCFPYFADYFDLTLHGRHHNLCTIVVAPVKLPYLHHCTGVVALVILALLPLVHWHYCPCHAGLFALFLHCAVDLQVSLPLLSWQVLSCGRHGRPRRR